MSDCLITGVQIDSTDAGEKTASTVFVTFSHPVKPGQLVGIDGRQHCSAQAAPAHHSPVRTVTRHLDWAIRCICAIQLAAYDLHA